MDTTNTVDSPKSKSIFVNEIKQTRKYRRESLISAAAMLRRNSNSLDIEMNINEPISTAVSMTSSSLSSRRPSQFGVHFSELTVGGHAKVPRILMFLCQLLLEHSDSAAARATRDIDNFQMQSNSYSNSDNATIDDIEKSKNFIKQELNLLKDVSNADDLISAREEFDKGNFIAISPSISMNLLKSWIRELPAPLMPVSMFSEALIITDTFLQGLLSSFKNIAKDIMDKSSNVQDHPSFNRDMMVNDVFSSLGGVESVVLEFAFRINNIIPELEELFFRLPRINRDVLEYFGVFLAKLSLFEAVNGCSLKGVANYFSPYILKPSMWGKDSRLESIPDRRREFLRRSFFHLFLLFVKRKHNILSSIERAEMESMNSTSDDIRTLLIATYPIFSRSPASREKNDERKKAINVQSGSKFFELSLDGEIEEKNINIRKIDLSNFPEETDDEFNKDQSYLVNSDLLVPPLKVLPFCYINSVIKSEFPKKFPEPQSMPYLDQFSCKDKSHNHVISLADFLRSNVPYMTHWIEKAPLVSHREYDDVYYQSSNLDYSTINFINRKKTKSNNDIEKAPGRDLLELVSDIENKVKRNQLEISGGVRTRLPEVRGNYIGKSKIRQEPKEGEENITTRFRGTSVSAGTNYDRLMNFPVSMTFNVESKHVVSRYNAVSSGNEPLPGSDLYPYDEEPGLLNHKPPWNHSGDACEECGFRFMGFIYRINRPKTNCNYCGRLLCVQCCSRYAVIPGFVLQQGIYSPKSVCTTCEEHLAFFFNSPALEFGRTSLLAKNNIGMSIIDSIVYARRRVTRFISFYLLSGCPARLSLLAFIPSNRVTFLMPEPRVSLRDFLDIKSGKFVKWLEHVESFFARHLEECHHCQYVEHVCSAGNLCFFVNKNSFKNKIKDIWTDVWKKNHTHKNEIMSWIELNSNETKFKNENENTIKTLDGLDIENVKSCSNCNRFCHSKCKINDFCLECIINKD